MANEDGAADPQIVERVTELVLDALRARNKEIIEERISDLAADAQVKLEAAIAAIQAQAGTLLKEAETAKTAATTASTESAALAQQADKSKAQIEAAEQAASKAQSHAESHATQAKTALDAAAQHKAIIESLAKRVAGVNEQLDAAAATASQVSTDYANHETKWTERFDELFAKVETLLPGAATAGLANGYLEEQQKYDERRDTAMRGFALSLIVLTLTLALAPLQLWWGSQDGSTPEANAFLLRVAYNLPIVIPAVWAAWLFSRKASSYDRLSEEYRHKMSVARSFIGFTRQLQQVEAKGASDDHPTRVLLAYMQDALAEICRPAVSAYDNRDPASPWDESLHKLARRLAPKVESMLRVPKK